MPKKKSKNGKGVKSLQSEFVEKGLREVKSPGRRYEPTNQDRRVATAMIAYGIPYNEIAACLGITPPTFYKAFPTEIRTASAVANAVVAESLFKNAVNNENAAAQIWWTKSKMGWSERNKEHVVNGASTTIQEQLENMEKMTLQEKSDAFKDLIS